ncbi:MAG: VacJ family lipoprotein [Desulfobacteraceae bacterium]|nr:VacJ family lipoprotein [Desulfobacteraceae bacterium]
MIRVNTPAIAVLIFLTAAAGLVFSGCAHQQSNPRQPDMTSTVAAPGSPEDPNNAPVTDGEDTDAAGTGDIALAADDGDATENPDWLDEDEPDWLDEDEPDWLDDTDDMQFTATSDPLSGFNRAMYHVNDFLYEGILSPVADAYRALFPSKIRIGVSNFFTNLTGPLRFVNCLLQGKGEAADAEFVRFFMNSTVGVLGFGNPAKEFPELSPSNEDLGQTFGSWGVGEGVFIIWPVLGPSTLRDTVGMIGDRFMHPVSYVNPSEVSYGLSAYERINGLSFRLGDYESLKAAAIDPYEAIRDAYLQYRRINVEK